MELGDLLISPLPLIKDLAERAQRIRNDYEAGRISKSEYIELTDDLLSLKHINDEMVGLELTRELWKAVELLKNIKFFASL